MADKPKTSDEILRHLIEIHQEAADREDLPDWVKIANADTARRIRKALEEDTEEEEYMKKRFFVTLNMPVTVEVEAEKRNGEVLVLRVLNANLPSVSDISDASTDDNLSAIDDAWADA